MATLATTDVNPSHFPQLSVVHSVAKCCKYAREVPFLFIKTSTLVTPKKNSGGWAPLARDLQEKGGTDG